jgi:transposase
MIQGVFSLTTWPIASCYEVSRDGFWLDRLLKQTGVTNVVVDSGSIKVDRPSRRAKTDRLDAEDLLTILVRNVTGRTEGLARGPRPDAGTENARHLQREIRTLKKEQTRIGLSSLTWVSLRGGAARATPSRGRNANGGSWP